MRLRAAQDLSSRLLLSLDRYCSRVAVAGSVRREAAEVGDIEIVAIPRDREGILKTWAPGAGVQWIKTGTPEIIPWEPKVDGKYWRGWMPAEQMKLDLFLATPENWGVMLLIRTGDAEFSEALVSHGKRIGKRVQGGYLRAGSEEDSPIIPTPEEQVVFSDLGLSWVNPVLRTGPRGFARAMAVPA